MQFTISKYFAYFMFYVLYILFAFPEFYMQNTSFYFEFFGNLQMLNPLKSVHFRHSL